MPNLKIFHWLSISGQVKKMTFTILITVIKCLSPLSKRKLLDGRKCIFFKKWLAVLEISQSQSTTVCHHSTLCLHIFCFVFPSTDDSFI